MSYVAIPPAYYALERPGTPYHPGGKGWLHANVPGWGENQNVAWPSQQAVNGMGDDAAPAGPNPPFSYVGDHPFAAYYRPGNSPWGSGYPNGPAYQSPRSPTCPTCVGSPIAPAIGAVGDACAPCEFNDGSGCLPCPDGADLPECQGCVGGSKPASALDSPLVGAITLGVLTAIGTGIVLAFLKKETRIPVGS